MHWFGTNIYPHGDRQVSFIVPNTFSYWICTCLKPSQIVVHGPVLFSIFLWIKSKINVQLSLDSRWSTRYKHIVPYVWMALSEVLSAARIFHFNRHMNIHTLLQLKIKWLIHLTIWEKSSLGIGCVLSLGNSSFLCWSLMG